MTAQTHTMKQSDRSVTLIFLLLGGFISFLLLIAGIFYFLKLCSVTMFHIPGFDHVFQFVVVVIPYVIFFSGYVYLHKQIKASPSKKAANTARVLLLIGSVCCLITLMLASMKLFGVQKSFVLVYEDNSQYGWIIQIVVLFFTALAVASGDAKEKGWMDKHLEEDKPVERM